MSAYTKSDLNSELRQGEIISNLAQFNYDSRTRDAIELVHAYSVVASQDCDLLRDYEIRLHDRRSVLNCVLLFEAQPAGTMKWPGGDIRRRAERHGEERFRAYPVNADTHYM